MPEIIAKSTADPTDPRLFRQVLGQYPTGVCVVTATESDGGRVGFVVGSFTSVSLDPPLIAFFPDKRSSSWPRIQSSGKFCVNILSADQEDICRKFASRTADKFAGVAHRDSHSGSPIIGGVVAWIDCEIESVTEAGDHYIVLGRVLHMDVESAALPLLFFQGGYGRFAPLSLAASNIGGALTEQLRQVDLVRSEMEQLVADIPGARCNAVVLVDGKHVVIATAGGLGSMSRGTLIGQRLPFMPPLGSVFAAWFNDAELAKWLEPLPAGEPRENMRARLAAVRSRGFSAILRSDAEQRFESMMQSMAVDPAAVDPDELAGQIRELNIEPVELTPEVKSGIGIIRVPIFGRDGGVVMVLAVFGFPRPTAAEDVDAYIERARSAGREATALLGGRVPAISVT